MQWVDIIQLRFVKQDAERLARELAASLAAGSGEQPTVRLYRNTTLGNDLSIHLCYESDAQPDPAMGERLASELQAHGLTDRSRWVQVTPDPTPDPDETSDASESRASKEVPHD